MLALHKHSDMQTIEKKAQAQKNKEKEAEMGRIYNETLEKAERDRKTGLEKLSQYVSRSNPNYVRNVLSKQENAIRE